MKNWRNSEKRQGVNEAVGVGKEDGQKHDELFVNTFIDTKVAAKFKSVLRLGKPDPIKKRPIMVIFHSEQEKEKIMRNLGNLKDNEKYKGVSIAEDYTLKDRETIKEWRDKAKAANEDEVDSKFIYRVRGSPKTDGSSRSSRNSSQSSDSDT